MKKSSPDIKSNKGGKEWFYTEIVKKHFFEPYKFLKDKEKFKADGEGAVGSPACGDMMKFWIKVDKKVGKIIDCRWRTFGCASAIASTSALAEMITEKGGIKIEKALKIRPQDIMKRLGGLPDIKVHCSVLGDQALRAAIENYKQSLKL
ncbi:MAG: iron-sulfur cluster assembly scaffold protein [Patescibacteria group bacterium]